MSPQEAGDGLESIVEFQVQIKGNNQREYEDKWQGWQHWTHEKRATKLTKDDQQLVLLLPARWWPDTLPEFESEGWWQRPQMLVKCRQCPFSFVENLSLGINKCYGCEEQMQTKGSRLIGIVYSPMPIHNLHGNSMICKEVTLASKTMQNSSIGQSAGLSILRSSVWFRQKNNPTKNKPRTQIYLYLSYTDPQARVLN